MEAPLPFDTTTVGTYFLGNTYPDSLTPENRNILYTRLVNRGARTGVLHEGIPGHHLQLSIAKHHGSAIRRYTHSTMLTEGWAMYCEEMMAREGLYGPDSLVWLLRVLPGMRFRACRVIIDARLHSGKMSFEEAVDFLRRHSTSDSLQAVGEVSRYTIEPTQAMSYLVGKSIILQIKAAVRRAEGPAFSLKKFHDRLLSYGSVPPPWIALDWIGSSPRPGPVRDRF